MGTTSATASWLPAARLGALAALVVLGLSGCGPGSPRPWESVGAAIGPDRGGIVVRSGDSPAGDMPLVGERSSDDPATLEAAFREGAELWGASAARLRYLAGFDGFHAGVGSWMVDGRVCTVLLTPQEYHDSDHVGRIHVGASHDVACDVLDPGAPITLVQHGLFDDGTYLVGGLVIDPRIAAVEISGGDRADVVTVGNGAWLTRIAPAEGAAVTVRGLSAEGEVIGAIPSEADFRRAVANEVAELAEIVGREHPGVDGFEALQWFELGEGIRVVLVAGRGLEEVCTGSVHVYQERPIAEWTSAGNSHICQGTSDLSGLSYTYSGLRARPAGPGDSDRLVTWIGGLVLDEAISDVSVGFTVTDSGSTDGRVETVSGAVARGSFLAVHRMRFEEPSDHAWPILLTGRDNSGAVVARQFLP